MERPGRLLESAAMKPVVLIVLTLLSGVVLAQQGELAKVKEQELEAVRERISELKERMDDAAEDRDRLTGELQEIEVAIARQRMRIKEIERLQANAQRRKAELDAELADREAHLDTESEELAAQVRTAYMSGSQEKIRLLLSQKDPATLGAGSWPTTVISMTIAPKTSPR